MEPLHIFIYLLTLLLIITLIIILYTKHITHKKNSDNLITVLSNNVDFLTTLNKKHEIIELKKDIDLYSKFKIILKISKCECVSFFKYDYSRRNIILHYVLSIDNNCSMIHNNIIDKILDNLPVTANLSILNILKSDDNDLYILNPPGIEENNDDLFRNLKKQNINTVYYQNIIKSEENPIGFISLAYKNENFILSNDEKIEILRVIEKIKTFI